MAMLDPEHRRPLSRKVRQIHSADHGTRYAVACADAAERRRGTGNEIAELVTSMSATSVERHLRMLCASGEIEKRGGGRSTYYIRKTI